MRISLSKLCRLTGKSYRTIRAKLETLPPVEIGKSGAHLHESTQALPMIYGIGTGDDRLDGSAEKARLDQARRVHQELVNRELEKSLISREAVNQELFELGRRVRDSLLTIPDRVSPSLAVEVNPVRVHEILLTEITTALKDLTNGH